MRLGAVTKIEPQGKHKLFSRGERKLFLHSESGLFPPSVNFFLGFYSNVNFFRAAFWVRSGATLRGRAWHETGPHGPGKRRNAQGPWGLVTHYAQPKSVSNRAGRSSRRLVVEDALGVALEAILARCPGVLGGSWVTPGQQKHDANSNQIVFRFRDSFLALEVFS